MRFGIALPIVAALASAEAIRRSALHAEQLGYDSVWTADHIVLPAKVDSKYPYTGSGVFRQRWDAPFYDPIGALGYLAGITERVRLGVSVLILPYRNAVATAKALATIDNLSGGRLVLGVGVGWMQEEFAALNLPAGYFAGRGPVSDESIQVFRALWSEGLSRFEGRYYRFADVGAYPKPAQPGGIPIWIGGNSGPALRRTARLGDGWHAITLTLEGFRARLARLRRLTEEAGRDPDALAISLRTGISQQAPGAPAEPVEPGQALAGDAAALADQVHAYAEAGVQELTVTFRSARDLDALLRAMEDFRAVVDRLAR